MPQIPSLLLDNTKGAPPELRVVTYAEAEAMMQLTFAELDASTLSAEVESDICFQIINSRLAWAGLDPAEVTTPYVVALMMVLSNGRPGTAVLWAYTLKQMYERKGERVALNVWSDPDFFGRGVPTEEYYHATWLAQKGYTLGLKGVDNYLDQREPWSLAGEPAAKMAEGLTHPNPQ